MDATTRQAEAMVAHAEKVLDLARRYFHGTPCMLLRLDAAVLMGKPGVSDLVIQKVISAFEALTWGLIASDENGEPLPLPEDGVAEVARLIAKRRDLDALVIALAWAGGTYDAMLEWLHDIDDVAQVMMDRLVAMAGGPVDWPMAGAEVATA